MITLTQEQAELALELITGAALGSNYVACVSEDLLNTLSEQLDEI